MLWLLEWFRTPSGFHYDSSCRSRQGFTGFRLKFRGYGSFPSTQRNTGRFWPKLGGVTCLWHGAQARNYSLGQVCLASHKMDLDLNFRPQNVTNKVDHVGVQRDSDPVCSRVTDHIIIRIMFRGIL